VLTGACDKGTSGARRPHRTIRPHHPGSPTRAVRGEWGVPPRPCRGGTSGASGDAIRLATGIGNLATSPDPISTESA